MNKKKSIVFLTTGLLLAASLTPMSGYAVSKTNKKLDATYAGIQIQYNNQQVQSDIEPFIVNGTTYIPLRMMGNLFQKSVEWDGINYKINVTDSPDSTSSLLQAQLNSKIAEQEKELKARADKIIELEKKIRDLEEEAKPDLDDLEEDLIDEFEEYEGIEFEISLDGEDDELELDIDIDLDTYQDEWDDLSSGDIENYIEDIVEEIQDQYSEDVVIDGQISDGSKTLVQFEVNSDGDLEIDNESKDLDDVENTVKSRYTNSWSGMTFDLETDKDDDDITFTLKLDYTTYKDTWDDLTDSKIEKFLSDIYGEIEDEFPSDEYNIDVIIEDKSNGKTMATYTQDSDGDDDFDRKSGY